jgi:hypothetical protein
MTTHFKAAAMLAFGVATLLSAGPASAETCDGTVQHNFRGITTQCYYLPTVSNGRVTGLQKEVTYGGRPFSNGFGQSYPHPGGAAGGGAWGHHGR